MIQLVNFKAKCKPPPQIDVDVEIVGDFPNNVFTTLVNAKSTLTLKFVATVRMCFAQLSLRHLTEW